MNARSKIKTSVKPARSFKKDLASHGDHSTFIVNMAHHIPDAMIALNNRFTIIGWNAAAEHTFGWKADEAVGKNFNRLLKTKPTVNGKSNPLTIARRMGKWSGEVTRVRKDGVRIWVWSSVSVVRNEAGNPIGFICISRDVTERKRMDEKLRESQAKLASVVNSAMDAMISLDEDQRIILFNPAAESMFGCPAAEAMGQPLDRFIPEQAYPCLWANQSDPACDGEAWTAYLHAIRRRGISCGNIHLTGGGWRKENLHRHIARYHRAVGSE
ncbi:MAG: PAS domain S-box protein [Chloroflexi bacterium]|nr:MAG: PAS domain S-box protein [Chloroflexota bacterium]